MQMQLPSCCYHPPLRPLLSTDGVAAHNYRRWHWSVQQCRTPTICIATPLSSCDNTTIWVQLQGVKRWYSVQAWWSPQQPQCSAIPPHTTTTTTLPSLPPNWSPTDLGWHRQHYRLSFHTNSWHTRIHSINEPILKQFTNKGRGPEKNP